jgi:UDP-glucose 4-epimerase
MYCKSTGELDANDMIGILGANGFIGRSVVRRLATNGHPIRAISRKFDTSFKERCPQNVEFIEADFTNSVRIINCVEGVSTLILLIGTSSPSEQNNHTVRDLQENVIPHVSCIEAGIKQGVQRVVFASSGGAVYGSSSSVPTNEEAPTYPLCSYGVTKLNIEKYINMYSKSDGIESVILRIANVYGPEQKKRHGQGLIPEVLNCLSTNRPVQVVGDGTAVRDYVFIDDVVDMIELTIAASKAANNIFNVGSGSGLTVNKVIEKIEKFSGMNAKRLKGPDRRSDTHFSVLDIGKAYRMLGWKPKTSFSEGLRRTIEWWKSEDQL